MKPTIYVITYHEFNHEGKRADKPIDSRFLDTDKNYIFYLIDKKVPPALQQKQTILEHDLDPVLHSAGGKHLGEWSFLLAEAKHAFCQYPFFMISSRFYEKNQWLYADLNKEWDKLFSYFKEYGWGYLPSYDRPLHWVNLSWEKLIKNKAEKYMFFPFTEKTYQLTEDLFKIKIPENYGSTPDLFCNYIGFRNHSELINYVDFYRPLINFFFNEDYSLKRDISPYVRATGCFRNEKPFTFYLELLCHLFFFKSQKKYFCLHYDGYYEIDETKKIFRRLESFTIPFKITLRRFFLWKWSKLSSSRILNTVKRKIKNQKKLYKIVKILIRK